MISVERRIRLLPPLLLLAAGISMGQAPGVKHGRPQFPQRSSPQPSHALTIPVAGTIKVDINAAHALNHFDPDTALGASVDAISVGSLPYVMARSNTIRMLGAGAGSISYRLYTELSVQDWHWNPVGTWSDAANSQGYFVGRSTPGPNIISSSGFGLTHRGATFDYGENSSFSNLTDGDANTYWKSNPYLTSAYTNESDSLHPQWVFVDLGTAMNVNAVRINWANPYALNYSVQYWTGDNPFFDPTNGMWANFPTGVVTNGTGGIVTLKLGSTPISAEYVRILMTESSNTYDTHGSSDARNKMGYAINEIGVGSLSASGVFTDDIVHAPNQTQTPVYVSSNDPWHTATTQSTINEQIGLDYLMQCELDQGLPTMVATPMLYSTPENAVAEVGYLTAKKYAITGIELGEEPDGQWVTPEDYAALFLQWATAIHKYFPNIKVGGPITSYNGVQTWADSSGETDFLKRFYAYLTSHGGASQLGFVSMEHYPFYQASLDWSLVSEEVAQADSIFTWVASAGIPSTTPVYVTEYNLSAAPDEPINDVLGALWQAVFVGEFLKHGGSGAFYYQYFPYSVSYGGTSYGLIGMLVGNENNLVTAEASQYFSNKLMTQQWCVAGKGTHIVYPAASTITDSSGNPVVLPYAVARPDGRYSLMLINTDTAAHSVTVSFSDTKTHYFSGSVTQCQFSAKDYTWLIDGLNSTAKKDGPFEQSTSTGSSTHSYSLPSHSITILHGDIK